MTYELDLEAADGRSFHLSARKDIHDDHGMGRVGGHHPRRGAGDRRRRRHRVHGGTSASRSSASLRLLTTMKVGHGRRARRPLHLAAFQRAFIGALRHTYGDQLAQCDDMKQMILKLDLSRLDGATRPLRLPPPETRWCGPGRRRRGRRPSPTARRLAPADPLPRWGQGARPAGTGLRHVQRPLHRPHHRDEPGRVPGRERLRRLAVRLPRQHRPAVGPDLLHHRRPRPGGLADRGGRGPRRHGGRPTSR